MSADMTQLTRHRYNMTSTLLAGKLEDWPVVSFELSILSQHHTGREKKEVDAVESNNPFSSEKLNK